MKGSMFYSRLFLMVFALTIQVEWVKGQYVTTLAGSSAGSKEGKGVDARFRSPSGLSLGSDGYLYVTDRHSHRIVRVSQEGEMGFLAGGEASGSKDGQAMEAEFAYPSNLVRLDNGNTYIVDNNNYKIRLLGWSNSSVVTFAGTGKSEKVDGAQSVAAFHLPFDIVAIPGGGFYVTDLYSLRHIDANNNVTTITGQSSSGYVNGTLGEAKFWSLWGLALAPNGDIYVSDSYNHCIRKISIANNQVTTFSGSGHAGFLDGAADVARFNLPQDLTFDNEGNLYVTDGENHAVRKISPDGTVKTIAGGLAGFTDGLLSEAKFNHPRGLAFDPKGYLYVGDEGNWRIRKVELKLRQIVSTSNLEDLTYGDDPIPLFDQTDQGFDISYTSSNPAVADINGNKLYIKKSGQFTLSMTSASDDTYYGLNKKLELNVKRGSHSLTVGELSPKTFGDPDFTLPVTSDRNMPLFFSSSNTDRMDFQFGKAVIKGAGYVQVTISSPANDFYEFAEAKLSFTIQKKDQVISFTDKENFFVGDVHEIGASTDTGLPLRFINWTSSRAEEVSPGKYRFTAVGLVQMDAVQDGDDNHNSVFKRRDYTISRRPQTIDFPEIGKKLTTDVPFELAATSDSGLPISFYQIDNSVATISGNKVTIKRAGTATITAYQTGNSEYEYTTTTQVLTVDKAPQTITFPELGTRYLNERNFPLDVKLSSGRSVTLNISDPSIANITSGPNVQLYREGTVQITAWHGGDETYLPADQVVRELKIEKAPQEITFAELEDKLVTDDPFYVSVSSSSGRYVELTSSNPDIASIEPDFVAPRRVIAEDPIPEGMRYWILIHKAGEVQITASQSGDSDYKAAPDVVRTLKINKLSQLITFKELGSKLVTDEPFELKASVDTNFELVYSSSDPTITKVEGKTVTILKAGTVDITVSQAGTDIYQAAGVTRTLQINKITQSITFDALEEKLITDAPFELQAAVDSGLDLIFSSSDPTAAKIDGKTVTILKAGAVEITASQQGTAIYQSASVTRTLQINKLKQTITFAGLPDKIMGDKPFELVATSDSELEIAFTTEHSEVATIAGNMVTLTGPGTTSITASQPGDEKYEAAQEVVQVLVVKQVTDVVDRPGQVYAYPNPVREIVHIQNSGKVRGVKLFDMKGKLNFVHQLDDTKIDMSRVQRGAYIMVLLDLNGEVIKSGRLIKE